LEILLETPACGNRLREIDAGRYGEILIPLTGLLRIPNKHRKSTARNWPRHSSRRIWHTLGAAHLARLGACSDFV